MALFKIGVILQFLLGMADAYFTYVGVSAGHTHELNPLMRALIESSWSSFFLVKVVIHGLFSVVLFLSLQQPTRIAVAVFWGSLIVYGTVFLWHLVVFSVLGII